MEKTRVLIVDDHTLIRDGIRALLALATNIEVIGEASNGMEALEKVRELSPHLVLMDLAMPIMGGLEATRRIRKEFPDVKVLALTQYDDRDYIVPVIEAGARGFVSKMAAFSELSSAIHTIATGGSFLSPSAAAVLIDECQQHTTTEDEKDPYHQLTDREREVLKLVAEGYTAKEIAEMLVISVRTAESYKTSMMQKLDIHNKTDLIKFAIRRGIITL
ncbi:MAG: response regulator transcription factor [Chloroflexi bacterium]|nr:response regulator transcription factor [Chloroflexota bacterium]